MPEGDRVPQLVPGWEYKAAALSPEEGFLLSRVDGVTPWEMLASISGLAPERADECLEAWLRDGLISLAGAAQAAPRADSASLHVDASLGLPAEVQERALAFESRLEGSYHALLGVGTDAESKEIKRAYFKLSRDFHPDRYFGKDLGAFAPLLDRIFKKIALAYELLMDPTTRAELARSMAQAPPPEAEAPPAPAAPTKPGTPQKFTKREWLDRMRKQFRLPEELLAERRFRAKQLAESADTSGRRGNWKEAASCIRLAIAFDPWNNAYKEQFGAVQIEIHRIRAEELRQEAIGAFDSRSLAKALSLYEEVLAYKPSDAPAHDKAAELCLELEQFDQAQEYADRACELEPESAAYHITRGRVLKRRGRRDRAIDAFETAQTLDPQDTRSGDELKKLRRKSGNARGGKQ